METNFRWFPFVGWRTIDRVEALEHYDIFLDENTVLKAFVFEWLWYSFGRAKVVEK